MLTEQYRPTCYADVIGQPKAINRINVLRARGLAGRAYYLTGPSGVGKTTIARLIAGEIAEPDNVIEIDAGSLTIDTLRRIESAQCMYGLGAKTGRAYIINEAHGLTANTLRALLVTLEPIPSHVCWIFTTTKDGAESFIDKQSDAKPFLSRCVPLPLTSQGLAPLAADHVMKIAQREGLDGQPLARYVRLANTCKSNIREMLQFVESGGMLNV